MSQTVYKLTLSLVLTAILTPGALSAHAEGTTATAHKQSADHKSASSSKKEDKKSEAKSAEKAGSKSKTSDKLTYDGPPVLDPSRFFGAAAMGYASVKACPEIASKLFCYCGCDISDSHTSLVDCFTSMHGVDCHICQEEAVLSLKMHRDGSSLAEIQKAIDQQYASKYPWKEDSPAYAKYKANREWKPFAETAQDNKATAEVGGDAKDSKDGSKPTTTANSKSKETKWTPVLKPGFQAGACCSKEADKKK